MSTPKYNLIEELRWRGMIQDITPETEAFLMKESVSGYIGFDPTADSLHIGSMVQIMLLMHMQKAGHKPIALVGGATGMVGDPSGKSAERNLLSVDVLNHNVASVRAQLEKFLDFEAKDNPAEMSNNYDWFGNMGFLEFIRDVGKHLTINYMMAKESVKKRIETGISFTEFSYQLLQGYDFYWLYQHKNCKLQVGGADQWGNMTTGTELIRRMCGGEAHCFTTPLITKADGGKFGKTEKGNIWLDANKTSPYEFYQFWKNVSDDDAKNYIKIFTFKTKEEIRSLITEHEKAPHLYGLQIALAEDITLRVHGAEALEKAKTASSILFGKATTESLKNLSEDEILSSFADVPQHEITITAIENGIGAIDFLAVTTPIFASKGEARRMLQGNGISINQEKIKDSYQISKNDLLQNKFILVQKGRRDYYLIVAK